MAGNSGTNSGPVFFTSRIGEYRIADLTPGRYLLRAESMRPPVDNRYGERDKLTKMYVPVYYPSALLEQAASPVDVGVGAEVHAIDIQLAQVTLHPSARVSGKVTGVQSGSQVAVLMVSTDGAAYERRAQASPPDYEFELSAPPGQYGLYSNTSSGGVEGYATASLTVAGKVNEVVLAMRPAPQIAGRVLTGESQMQANLRGIRVTLIPPKWGLAFEARSDAAGRLTFARPIPPGRYAIDVDVRSIPDGYFIHKVSLGGQEIPVDDVEIQASTDLEVALGNTAGKISGSATDGHGRPFAGASVTLISPEGKSRPRSQDVGEDGTFTFTGLEPGKYKLFAWERLDHSVWQDPEYCKRHENRAKEVSVAPHETRDAQIQVITMEEMY